MSACAKVLSTSERPQISGKPLGSNCVKLTVKISCVAPASAAVKRPSVVKVSRSTHGVTAGKSPEVNAGKPPPSVVVVVLVVLVVVVVVVLVVVLVVVVVVVESQGAHRSVTGWPTANCNTVNASVAVMLRLQLTSQMEISHAPSPTAPTRIASASVAVGVGPAVTG